MFRILPFLLFALVACKPGTPATEETQTTSADTTASSLMNVPGLNMLWETEKTLTTSESVFYDKTNDVLYVSCINGVPPDKKDNDGFISRVGLDGTIKDLKWVTGLSGPKGMAMHGHTLYVTDIDHLVSIDVTTGKIVKKWKVDGATFLNDVHVTSDGKVYFTDSGTNKIHLLDNDNITQVFEDAALEGINGILIEDKTMYLAGYNSGNVYRLNMTNGALETIATEIPAGDGVERYGDALIVSNWNGQVYHIAPDGETTLLLDSQEAKLNSADIEIISDKNLLLVPTFFGNGVTAYTLLPN